MRELEGTCELILCVERLQRRVDVVLIDMTATQLGDERAAPEPFSLMLSAHDRLGESSIVDQADALETRDLVADLLRVESARGERLLQFPSRHIASCERVHADVDRALVGLRLGLVRSCLRSILATPPLGSSWLDRVSNRRRHDTRQKGDAG